MKVLIALLKLRISTIKEQLADDEKQLSILLKLQIEQEQKTKSLVGKYYRVNDNSYCKDIATGKQYRENSSPYGPCSCNCLIVSDPYDQVIGWDDFSFNDKVKTFINVKHKGFILRVLYYRQD